MQPTRIVAVAIILSLATSLATAQRGGVGFGHYSQHNGGAADFRRQMALHATSEQREMFQQCHKSSNLFRSDVEEVGKSLASRQTSWPSRPQMENTQNDLASMGRGHNIFVATLSTEQHQAIKGKLRKLVKLQSSLTASLRTLDGEFAGAPPNSVRVNKALHKLQGDVKEWQKQHSKSAAELGLAGRSPSDGSEAEGIVL